MFRPTHMLVLGVTMFLLGHGSAEGRGFGGGGFHAGGSFGGYRAESFGGYRGYGATGSYDRSWTGTHGGSVNVSGAGGAVRTPWGAAAGGERQVQAEGPGGKTYDGSHEAGVAVGPYGRMVGGSARYGTASGPLGVYSGGSKSAFATDFGLSHYSTFGAAGAGGRHSTAYWSNGYMADRSAYVHTNFNYYNCFHPAWYTAHPGAWYAAGWGAGRAWEYASWASLASLWAIPAYPVYYDYGNTIVYQNDNVYVNGQDAGTAQTYAQQAITLVDQGQQAAAPPKDEWTPLGVFALVQGDEKTSNNVFQLAVNKAGVLRGNYYDGLLDSTTPVYGTVDKKSQRAAWTIGKSNARVFETGIYNLTKAETPVLVHFNTDRTLQMLLVRMEQPKK